MSTTPTPESTTELTPPPGPGTKTLSVKHVPHAVWRRARQNALASNLSFGDYVVKLLACSGPVVPGVREAESGERATGDRRGAVPSETAGG